MLSFKVCRIVDPIPNAFLPLKKWKKVFKIIDKLVSLFFPFMCSLHDVYQFLASYVSLRVTRITDLSDTINIFLV